MAVYDIIVKFVTRGTYILVTLGVSA